METAVLLMVATAWLCVTHATPLPNATDVLGPDSPVREGDFLSPHVTLSRSEPTTQPFLDNTKAKAVCDTTSAWVTNKHTAVDIRGKNVTLLSKLPTSLGQMKQYFFETRCKPRRSAMGSCWGVDQNYWISECKTTQTYVRALTMGSNKTVAWRFIKIDAGCVCTIRPRQQDAGEYGGQEET